MNVSGQYNLQELFKELREKEGIESVDNILREVINSGCMSFNKIKPVYKEMLMKLVMTMSKDEIFIRLQDKDKELAKLWFKGGKRGEIHAEPAKTDQGTTTGKEEDK